MNRFLNSFLIIFFSFFILKISQAQSTKRYICGYTKSVFIEKDLNTCQMVIIDSLKGVSIIQGMSTFDHVHNRFLQAVQGPKGTDFIQLFDANTGKLLPDISLNGSDNNEIEYDDSNNTIYGIGRQGFVSFNLTTSTFDSIGPIPSGASVSQGGSTFDPVNGRFFDLFNYSSLKFALGSIDIHSGKLTFYNITFTANAPEYCKANGKVYGLHTDSSTRGANFISYDPASNKMTILDTNLDMSVVMGSSTFDNKNNVYIFEGNTRTSPSNSLIMIDTSGNLTICDSAEIYEPEAFSSDSINLITTSAYPLKLETTSLNIYPNPATSTLTIESTTNPIRSITVFDATGREVYSQQNLKTQSQSVSVSNFPEGIYIAKLGFDNGSYTAKFMKD